MLCIGQAEQESESGMGKNTMCVQHHSMHWLLPHDTLPPGLDCCLGSDTMLRAGIFAPRQLFGAAIAAVA